MKWNNTTGGPGSYAIASGGNISNNKPQGTVAFPPLFFYFFDSRRLHLIPLAILAQSHTYPHRAHAPHGTGACIPIPYPVHVCACGETERESPVSGTWRIICVLPPDPPVWDLKSESGSLSLSHSHRPHTNVLPTSYAVRTCGVHVVATRRRGHIVKAAYR